MRKNALVSPCATCTINWIESEMLHVSVHCTFILNVLKCTWIQLQCAKKKNYQKNSHSLCELMEYCHLSSKLNQTNDMMKWICTGPVSKSKEELLDNIQLAPCHILFAYISHWGACVNKNLKYVGNNILNFWKFMICVFKGMKDENALGIKPYYFIPPLSHSAPQYNKAWNTGT